ncbi:DUF397 domain-containing protein [Streptomyces sp. UNOB3_S3]|uniref:DUF397 domain-containing protein n=1 Tax=Streptomyces sp. UNOB3_S3 TaxID=2871682 RepID=UPI001E3953EB|nr:DUF397 domain-containing protein [Streptomyces sp. UNOB3_S3]MCC3774605.1 DUF397 domain-containing protein [Streptomyces sp. UNOB3_S3]
MSETIWQKSSFSGDRDECVELGKRSGAIAVRESDTPEAVVKTTRAGLRGLILAVKAGGLDRLIQ